MNGAIITTERATGRGQQLAIVLLIAASVLFLAGAAAELLGRTPPAAGTEADYRITFRLARRLPGLEPPPIELKSAFVDDRLVLAQPTELKGDCTLRPDTPEQPLTSRVPPGDRERTLSFRGRSAVLGLRYQYGPVTLAVTKNGEPFQTLELPKSWGTSLVWRRIPAPPNDGLAPYLLTLAIGTAFAFCLRPWRGRRGTLFWALLVTATLQVFGWLALPIAISNDSWGYLGSANRLLELKSSYFPPGYPLVLVALLPTGSWQLPAVTALQAIASVWTIAWLYQILVRSVSPAAALAATLTVACLSSFLVAGRSVLTESLACWSVIGAIHALLRHRDTGQTRYGILAGLLAAYGGAIRIVPLAAIALVMLLVHWRRPWRSMLRPLAIPIGVAFGPILVAVIGLQIASTGKLEFAGSLGTHLYNSAVAAKRLHHAEGPVSRQYPEVVMGDWDSIAGSTSVMRRLRNDHGMSFKESQATMQAIALEAIGEHPFRFLWLTVTQAWDQLLMAPYLDPIPVLSRTAPEQIPPPTLAVSRPGLTWLFEQRAHERMLWPWLCALALGAVFGSLWLPRRAGLLALALVTAGLIGACALLEYPVARYSALSSPALVALAIAVPAEFLGMLILRIRPPRSNAGVAASDSTPEDAASNPPAASQPS